MISTRILVGGRKALVVAQAALSIAVLAALAWIVGIAAVGAFTLACGSLDCAPVRALGAELRAGAPTLITIAAALVAVRVLLWTRRRADDAA